MHFYVDTDDDLVAESEDDMSYLTIQEIIDSYKKIGYTVTFTKDKDESKES